MSKRPDFRVVPLAIIVMLQSLPAGAMGLALRFVDVTLEKVPLGTSFNMRVLKNLPLVVSNLDDTEGTDVVVESVLPQLREMKESYEPIPDPTWIKVIPNRFHLGPKASASADVLVTIPNDPKLVGHHFEGILFAHTEQRNRRLNAHGVVFQTGLRTRFRMSIETLGPASLQKEKALKKLATINTNFSVSPDNLFVQSVPVGKPFDLKLEKRASFKIINQADDPVELKIGPIPPDPLISPQAGYKDVPDYKWLTVTPNVIKVAGNAIKEIKLRINIPDKPEYKNQKYMFVLQTTLIDESLPLAYDNMLYVTTEP